MITLAWIVVGIVALIIIGPMLLQMWRTPGAPAPKDAPFSARANRIAVAVFAIVMLMIAIDYFNR